MWVHGGPGGQSRVGYSSLLQYLVNHGYVVYAVNNRGSSGYGKTFHHLDDRKHGKGAASAKKENRERGYKAVRELLDKHLKNLEMVPRAKTVG